MNMKTKVLATALFAALGMGAASVQAAPSDTVRLTGIITDTTCDVQVNNGTSNLFVGGFRVSDFALAGVMTQVGNTKLPVLVNNCTAIENGHLVVTGTTSVADPSNTLFVGAATDTTGFMIQDAGGVQMIEGDLTQVPFTSVIGAVGSTYDFEVGMGTTALPAVTGTYATPVHVTYYVP